MLKKYGKAPLTINLENLIIIDLSPEGKVIILMDKYVLKIPEEVKDDMVETETTPSV